MNRKFILTSLLFLGLNIALKSYNTHLQSILTIKHLESENYKVVELNTLEMARIKPCGTSSVKSYMDRSKITSETSEQHRFIEENMEAKNGLWFDREGYLGVALGSWFGDIGSRWNFELSSGETLYTVKIEHKADKHTINGCEQKDDKSIIEIVVDEETNPYWIGENGYILNGNFNNVFEGMIVSVRKEN